MLRIVPTRKRTKWNVVDTSDRIWFTGDIYEALMRVKKLTGCSYASASDDASAGEAGAASVRKQGNTL